MRHPPSWLIAVSCIVAGCASGERFRVNGNVIHVPPEKQQEIIQAVWAAETLQAVAKRSRAAASDHGEILAVIGEIERSGTAGHPPCDQLKLVAIQNWQLMRVQFAADTFVISPKTYLDHWRVDACGTVHSWLVYDDKLNGGELSMSHTDVPLKGPPTVVKPARAGSNP